MLNANSVRVGNIINFKNKLCVVTKTMHTQPGKGGAFVQMELKDISAGTKYNERFRSEDKIEKVHLDTKEMQFLYADGENLNFMDNETYETITISKDSMSEDHVPFLTEGMIVATEMHEGTVISVSLPDQVEVEVDTTESVVKGQTAASSNKPAILTNGVRVMVPPFINNGEKIIVKTETLTYFERSK